MSVGTFDGLKGHNVRNIRKALAGAVFAKRWEEGDEPITQIYTAAGGLVLPAGYQSVGVTSKSAAAKFARDTGTSDVESWGYGEPTRRDITSDITTLQFTMQESKKLVFELYNGTDLTNVQPDTEQNIVMDKPTSPQTSFWRIFTLSKDGDGANAIYFLKWLPRCSITGVEDQELSEENELSYAVTVTGYNDPRVLTSVREVWGGPGLDTDAMGFTTGA